MRLELKSELKKEVTQVVERIIANSIASRIAAKDSRIWGAAAEPEASIRLGWVDSPKEAAELIPHILQLRDEFSKIGVDRFVLCGMGGSSLAPEVISKSENKDLFILDSTSPDQVRLAIKELARTAIIVSSKSGSTVETDSQKRIFESAYREAGIDPAGRIVIVTDPGSPLERDSNQSGYKVFNADTNVGGRYSALTAFGLVPSGLVGCDLVALVQSAQSALPALAADSFDNPAIWLAAAIAGSKRRDKFLIESGSLSGFGDWVEQLVAESTGKESRGVLPIAVEIGSPEKSMEITDLLNVSQVDVSADVFFDGSLGELFVLWEFATAIAGWLLEINPFDQPNVESAKVAARSMLDGKGEILSPLFVDKGIAIRAGGFSPTGATVEASIEQLLAMVQGDKYLGIHAYLPPLMYPQFQKLRAAAARRTRRPVTFGWGPRFLHSTGQYHKGGPKQGVFLQLTYNPTEDLSVPGRSFTFGELLSAQASGDAKVLADAGLPVLTLESNDPLAAFELIVRSIES